MKLKILVKMIEKLLGMTDRGDEPRADMFLPDRLLAMALVLCIALEEKFEELFYFE